VIIVQSPLRVSFFGGGTDFPSFYCQEGGCVLTSTIDKYIFVTVKYRFDKKLRIGYTHTEMVDRVDEIQHELIREALRITGINEGIEVSTMGDIPSAGSGLGSSSTVTVGLLNAIHTYLGQPQNLETLADLGGTTIVANCPHCFNSLRNEYPMYGGSLQVLHHTEYIARLVAQGRLQPLEEVRALLAYHDPCYLGRHNDVYREPRALLRSVPGLQTVEMPRHGQRGFCCGAGGARMWMEERIGKRINQERMDEAASTGADMVGVACPYCLIMLDDGARARGDRTEVLDVAQILARSISDRPPVRPPT